MSADLLPAVVAEPKSEVTGSVIWLHGLGADGNDFVPILPMLPLADLGVRVILPHAQSIPVSINGGFVMPAWYDIREGDLRERNDEVGIRASAEQVSAFVQAEREKGMPAERIALVGFSQGGAMALHVGLRSPERLAGIAALSTYLVLEESLAEEVSEAQQETPVFQAHGTRDPVVSLERGQAAREWLAARGYGVEWHDYPMEHAVCPEEIEALGLWLARIFAP